MIIDNGVIHMEFHIPLFISGPVVELRQDSIPNGGFFKLKSEAYIQLLSGSYMKFEDMYGDDKMYITDDSPNLELPTDFDRTVLVKATSNICQIWQVCRKYEFWDAKKAFAMLDHGLYFNGDKTMLRGRLMTMEYCQEVEEYVAERLGDSLSGMVCAFLNFPIVDNGVRILSTLSYDEKQFKEQLKEKIRRKRKGSDLTRKKKRKNTDNSWKDKCMIS